MVNIPFPLAQRMMRYCVASRRILVSPLGAGKDGDVFLTSRGTALKLIHDQSNYRRERDAYLRLRQRDVTEVNGFTVPRLHSYFDEIWAIEMSVVQPPYILDFASVRLDEPVEFDSDAAAHRDELIHDLFGERAADVFFLLHQLRQQHGVHMLDARPANIAFE